MAVHPNFAIKHIRPITEEGYETFCNDALVDLLRSMDFTYVNITEIFGNWRITALSDPYSESNRFVGAAQQVSQARWEELYKTDESTLMYLDAVQLVALGKFAPGPNTEFTWTAPTRIAISVTIKRHTGGHHIVWEAKGFKGATDGNGNIIHFGGLVT
ncbi:hypothetical protein FE840_009610 [Peteryoungia desertarenae]|uniref:SnoaL-like domain-containing protein n=1 Tax=Peteryoungia desertarenae TaxID=1813451 RepID=A0ABX6QMN0_9HYPH|nr:hypothetical protein [Peteryoungia desertarenae]QLF69779.1 hypothetical protein FE840_009610 [Peteryoungia desertarenae]